jgi:DNA mismatch repair protein MutS2
VRDPTTEIDLHGMTVDEAIPAVNQFLDKVYRKHIRRAWIIHGKGTGTLRRAVRLHLMKHPLVSSCANADAYMGGDGVTQVEIVD